MHFSGIEDPGESGEWWGKQFMKSGWTGLGGYRVQVRGEREESGITLFCSSENNKNEVSRDEPGFFGKREFSFRHVNIDGTAEFQGDGQCR